MERQLETAKTASTEAGSQLKGGGIQNIKKTIKGIQKVAISQTMNVFPTSIFCWVRFSC